MKPCALAPLLALLFAMPTTAQPLPDTITDEAKVPIYVLPDVLRATDGSRIDSAGAWRRNRPALLKIFEERMYGRAPVRPPQMRFEVREEDAKALNGTATRRQIAIHFSDRPGAPVLDLLLYLPNQPKKTNQLAARTPVFLGLNFWGNHTVHGDPAILLPRSWLRDDPERGVENNRASDKGRGAQASRWPIEAIVARGYGVATRITVTLTPILTVG
jgi:hypothetical protein